MILCGSRGHISNGKKKQRVVSILWIDFKMLDEPTIHAEYIPDCSHDIRYPDMPCYPLIVFEGIDGSGKTTVSKAVARKLGAKWSCEPNSLIYKYMIRESLIKEERALLFAADRAQHCKILYYDLMFGPCVVDRYAYSNVVYQSILDKIRASAIWSIQPPNIITPELIVLLKTEPETALDRCIAKGETQWTYKMLHDLQLEYEYVISSQLPQFIILNNNKDTDLESLIDRCVLRIKARLKI